MTGFGMVNLHTGQYVKRPLGEYNPITERPTLREIVI